jgi:hypothetical protein
MDRDINPASPWEYYLDQSRFTTSQKAEVHIERHKQSEREKHGETKSVRETD